MKTPLTFGSVLSSVLLAGAAATAAAAISFAPMAGADPVECSDPGGAARGAPCEGTGDPTEAPAPAPDLGAQLPAAGGADPADCVPGRVCSAP
jgi:hypothetical protein